MEVKIRTFKSDGTQAGDVDASAIVSVTASTNDRCDVVVPVGQGTETRQVLLPVSEVLAAIAATVEEEAPAPQA